MRQVQEKTFMSEWNETEIKIQSWLTSAENEAEPFDCACQNISDLEDQVTEHQVSDVTSQQIDFKRTLI